MAEALARQKRLQPLAEFLGKTIGSPTAPKRTYAQTAEEITAGHDRARKIFKLVEEKRRMKAQQPAQL